MSQDKRAVRFLEGSKTIRERVCKAREIQQKRFKKDKAIHSNAEMRNKDIKKYCFLSKEAERVLKQGASAFQLSARSYFKMIKIARTIADLQGAELISAAHMAEALQYRQS